MSTNEKEPTWTHHAKIDEAGRLSLPLDLRQRKEFDIGSTVVIIESEDKIEICTTAQAVRNAHEYFRSVIPAGVSLVDELIEERREEAQWE